MSKKAGALTPDIDKGEGTGHRRLLSADNFFEAIIIVQIMKFGLPRMMILSLFESIKNVGDRKYLSPTRFFSGPDIPENDEYLIITSDNNKVTHTFLKDIDTDLTQREFRELVKQTRVKIALKHYKRCGKKYYMDVERVWRWFDSLPGRDNTIAED